MRTPRVPAPSRHDPTHGPRSVNHSANHPANHSANEPANHSASEPANGAVNLARRMTKRLTTPTLGLALLAFMPLMPLSAGPIACASGTGTPPPAHRNNAERPPPFALAPDFSVPDATGTPRDLASLMGPKGLVLVLYRGHW